MPHLIIIDRNGNVIDSGHKTDESETTNIANYELEHKPTQIIIEQPTFELAELVLKTCAKYFKN